MNTLFLPIRALFTILMYCAVILLTACAQNSRLLNALDQCAIGGGCVVNTKDTMTRAMGEAWDDGYNNGVGAGFHLTDIQCMKKS